MEKLRINDKMVSQVLYMFRSNYHDMTKGKVLGQLGLIPQEILKTTVKTRLFDVLPTKFQVGSYGFDSGPGL